MSADRDASGADAAPSRPPRRDEVDAVAGLTPARVLLGRAGTAYRTSTALRLRADHAAARDALHETLALDDPELAPLVAEHGLFEVSSAAEDLAVHLARPDLGRRLSDDARARLVAEGTEGAELQVVVGDGLSSRAVKAQVPGLLPLLLEGARARGWTTGRPFLVHRCRVGVLNEVGEVLGPTVVVLLVGERPGLATAESLSAYMAHRPRSGCTDADRNLVSNIHAGGTASERAARRILEVAAEMRIQGRSGHLLAVPPVGGALGDGFDPPTTDG